MVATKAVIGGMHQNWLSHGLMSFFMAVRTVSWEMESTTCGSTSLSAMGRKFQPLRPTGACEKAGRVLSASTRSSTTGAREGVA